MNYNRYTLFTASENDDDRRIDTLISKFIPHIPPSGIYSAIRKGIIRINEKKVSPQTRVKTGDIVAIQKILLNQFDTKKDKVPGKNNINLPIIYEDSDILIINKPAGQIVHGVNSLATKVNLYLETKLPSSLSFSPGPLHRLDRNTSGLVTFSCSLKGARYFSTYVQDRSLEKYYIGITDGILKGKGIWENTMNRENLKSYEDENGVTAVTEWKSLYSYKGKTLVLFKIKTGRSHQIRFQSSFNKHPLSGDKKYGSTTLSKGYFLHACLLKIPNKGLMCGGKSFWADPSLPNRQIMDNFFPKEISDKYIKQIQQILLTE